MKSQPIPQHARLIPPNTPTSGGMALVPDPSRRATPDDMIFAGIKAGVPIETLERLYALKQKYEADEARKAYVAAMAEFKQNPPEIFKRSQVSFSTAKGKTEYMHADLGEVCQQVVSALAGHGFSHAWNPEQAGGKIKVTCILTHAQGHSEAVSLEAAADDSGGKNAIQAVASTVTYLQRYSLLAITGLATKGMDNDGRGAPDVEKFSDEILAKVADFNSAILEAMDEVELRHVGGDIAGAGLPPSLRREVRDRFTMRLTQLRKAVKDEKDAAAALAAQAGAP